MTTTTTTTTTTTHHTLRIPALVGGLGLLVMAALAGWATLGVVETLVTAGDAGTTAQDILAAATTFRFGVIALTLTAVLDLVVAWALWAYFGPAHRLVSAIAGAARAVYAVVFLAAISHLAAALEILTAASTVTESIQIEALRRIETFQTVWDAGLSLFGLHLLLLGYLAWRASYAPRFLGWLLAIAGVGYIIDSAVALVAPGSFPELSIVTFIGEVMLLVWLLVKGRNATVDDHGSRSTRTSLSRAVRWTIRRAGLMAARRARPVGSDHEHVVPAGYPWRRPRSG